MDNKAQLWLVQPDKDKYPASNVKLILWAEGREEAKDKAATGWLRGMGNPDNFICTPITAPGDRVRLEITLNV